MTYTVLAVCAVTVAALLDLVVLRTRLLLSRTFWYAYAIMFAFQLLVNGILTGLPVVSYDPDTIIGARIAHAPVEDLLFGFALILCTLTSWARLTRTADRAPVR
jgi:lycopene cyclase domain-containing protein